MPLTTWSYPEMAKSLRLLQDLESGPRLLRAYVQTQLQHRIQKVTSFAVIGKG